MAALLWATPYSNVNWRDQITTMDGLEDARLLMAQGAQFYCGNGNTSTWAIDKCAMAHKPKPEVWADWFLRILPAAARLRTVQILQEDALVTLERVMNDSDCLLYNNKTYLFHQNP